ncbi:MAG: hypothetical protein U5L96_10735 [Owenweeksia sp.]|nr:hypothetical protein [Owenweeksia sp.]
MQLRTRPKDSFIEMADWDQLYILANYWKSDLSFHCDELRFLRQLVNRHFNGLVDNKNAGRVQAIASRILNLSSLRASLSEQVESHQERIILLIEKQEENEAPEYDPDIREDHLALEDEIHQFVKDLRTLKKEVFWLTERIMEGNKLRRLLSL